MQHAALQWVCCSTLCLLVPTRNAAHVVGARLHAWEQPSASMPQAIRKVRKVVPSKHAALPDTTFQQQSMFGRWQFSGLQQSCAARHQRSTLHKQANAPSAYCSLFRNRA